jgi:hypothetical protein
MTRGTCNQLNPLDLGGNSGQDRKGIDAPSYVDPEKNACKTLVGPLVRELIGGHELGNRSMRA